MRIYVRFIKTISIILLQKKNMQTLTNIGETHLEFLKNDKIVAKAKGEMVPFIHNTLVFNFDDRYFDYFFNNS